MRLRKRTTAGVQPLHHIGGLGDLILDGDHTFNTARQIVQTRNLCGCQCGAAQRDDAGRGLHGHILKAFKLAQNVTDAHCDGGVLRGTVFNSDGAGWLSAAVLRKGRAAHQHHR